LETPKLVGSAPMMLLVQLQLITATIAEMLIKSLKPYQAIKVHGQLRMIIPVKP
jgi:hypothetical protein